MSNPSKTFLGLDKQESINACKAILENGNVLINAGSNCARDGSYGLAISLSILGIEEWIKATLILLKGYGIRVERIEEMKTAITSNHRTRHETVALFQLLNIVASLPDSLSNVSPKKVIQDLVKDPTEFLDNLFGSNSMLAAFDNIEWWMEANGYKNRGIYSEYNGKLLRPSDVTIQEYLKAKKVIDSTINSITKIHARFENESVVKELVANVNKAFDLYLSSDRFVTKSKYESETLPWKEYIPSNAKMLILGTFPTKKSNRTFEFFYPNKANRFWPTLARVANIPLTEFNGESAVIQRKTILDALQAGISDTGHKILRQKESSLDDNLFPIEFTDVFKILKEHPTIHTILLTSSSKGNSALNWLMAYCELNNMSLKMPDGKLPREVTVDILNRKIKIIAVNSPSRAASISDEALYEMYSEVIRRC